MTITLSQQTFDGLFQETVEPSQHPDPDDVLDVVYKYPRRLGQGYWRKIQYTQLRLPNGDNFTFRSEKPLAGVTEITVTNVDANTVRVTVVGEKALPTVELFNGDEGLIFGITPSATATQPQAEKPTPETPQEQPVAQPDEPIELVVTGEQDGYRVPNASTATRTDTPLRDIPQSIQVVPQQVIKDQGATRLIEVLQNVPGVVQGFRSPRRGTNEFNIRGFYSGSNLLLNGSRLRVGTGQPILDFSPNIDRVEVLKGPASVLFGSGELGGTVNVVTKQPLRDPYAEIEFSAGNFNAYSITVVDKID